VGECVEVPKTGELCTWAGVGGVRIVNLFTQEPAVSHGAKPGLATIENVNDCLKALRKVIEVEKFKSVALPRLATGVSGLEWIDVKPLIEKHLGHLSIPAYVSATYQSEVQQEKIFKRGQRGR
jgi:O-acetyl-ADP-ribose deacetylase (regulator of RNase III)